MKSFRKVVIASALAVAPVLAAGIAGANSDLVPGSRLVGQYWDVNGPRSTLLFLTNVSHTIDLRTSSTPSGICGSGNGTSTACGVHFEFYDKNCTFFDTTGNLSPHDLDQFDLVADSDLGGVSGLPNKLGWVDIDIRTGGAQHPDPGVQANVLLGTTILTDAGSDFAVAYPMAASQGSSNATLNSVGYSIGGTIVTRIGNGNANAWTGGYESFPARVFVPMFFAEGNNHGQTFASSLAIAGPAQSVAQGEAPGQNLGSGNNLIDADILIYDACEHSQSDHISGHYIFGTLDALFVPTVTAPYVTTCAGYPSADVDREGTTAANAFEGGWIDIKNNLLHNPTTGGVVSTGTSTTAMERGVVGVLVQHTASRGDATQLWGDCSWGQGTAQARVTALTTANAANADCRRNPQTNISEFTLVDSVNHADIQP